MPPGRIATLLFHDVVDRSSDSGIQQAAAAPYKITPAAFASCLNAIAAGPVAPVTVDALDLSTGGDRVMLTFDDGGVSAMHIADRLETHGWRGHFFVTTNMIGSKEFVSAEHIRDLDRRGHVVGSHSHTHPDIFYSLSDEQMVDEWTTSLGILSDILGKTVHCASVPGGDIDGRVPVMAGRAGIRELFTSEPLLRPWCVGETLCLGRICCYDDTPVATVGRYAQFRGFGKALAIRRTKQAIKKVCFPLYRRWVQARAQVKEGQ